MILRENSLLKFSNMSHFFRITTPQWCYAELYNYLLSRLIGYPIMVSMLFAHRRTLRRGLSLAFAINFIGFILFLGLATYFVFFKKNHLEFCLEKQYLQFRHLRYLSWFGGLSAYLVERVNGISKSPKQNLFGGRQIMLVKRALGYLLQIYQKSSANRLSITLRHQIGILSKHLAGKGITLIHQLLVLIWISCAIRWKSWGWNMNSVAKTSHSMAYMAHLSSAEKERKSIPSFK